MLILDLNLSRNPNPCYPLIVPQTQFDHEKLKVYQKAIAFVSHANEILAWVIHEDRSETKQKASVARRAPLFRLKASRQTSMSRNGVPRSKWSLLQVAVDRS